MSAVVEARVEQPVWLREVTARWLEVLADPNLHDLPFKIETNRSGQLVMSPAKNIHGYFQFEIASRLRLALGGTVMAECSVATPEGVKVADMVWASSAFIAEHAFADPYAHAPEICVEIKSPSNAQAELLTNVRLYLDAGAKEVWLVDAVGVIAVHDANGPVAGSAFAVSIEPVLRP